VKLFGATDMTDFRIKTLRCEWQVVSQEVDQYGMTGPALKRIVFSVWPTSEEAYNDLPNYGYEHAHVKGRWIPNGTISNYQRLEVQYREVEVK
jgi:hypothetical protein